MISYKDMTFCQDWCDNKECPRNWCQIDQDYVRATQIPVATFVKVPMFCKEHIPKGSKSGSDWYGYHECLEGFRY